MKKTAIRIDTGTCPFILSSLLLLIWYLSKSEKEEWLLILDDMLRDVSEGLDKGSTQLFG